jgi:hypothetical protein
MNAADCTGRHTPANSSVGKRGGVYATEDANPRGGRSLVALSQYPTQVQTPPQPTTSVCKFTSDLRYLRTGHSSVVYTFQFVYLFWWCEILYRDPAICLWGILLACGLYRFLAVIVMVRSRICLLRHLVPRYK